MEDSYRTFEKPSEGFFRDRNSRFLAFAYSVNSVDQVNEIFSLLKKKYHDARHHCYAYRINPEKEQYRLNDDGEPSGTAGKPIYNQLVANDLFNAVIVVVRYFGGTLLGTGGLINAYRSASTDAIIKGSIVTRYIENNYALKFPYSNLNAVMKILKEENLNVSNAHYEIECSINTSIRKGASQRILERLSVLGDIHIDLLQTD